MIDIKPIQKYTFRKDEKLCAETTINKLFTLGESFIAYPLRVVFCTDKVINNEDSGLSVLVSVSKKKFKRAVKRNRIKRLIREAYRLNKTEFTKITDESMLHIDLAFIYLNTEIVSYDEFEKAMLKAAKMLSKKLEDK